MGWLNFLRPVFLNYLPKSPMNQPDHINEVFAGAEVAEVVQSGPADLSDWAELMEAVEALCPVWPAESQDVGSEYRL